MSEPIDLEEYAKQGKPVPPDASYNIRIDKEKFVVDSPTITGKQLLDLVKKTPDKWGVYEIISGKPQRIQPAQAVDLTKHGIERFTTLALDQTEG
ncbi:MAG: hypothetical protein PVSMB1_15830 [Gemmatimonadaceae bacterium]